MPSPWFYGSVISGLQADSLFAPFSQMHFWLVSTIGQGQGILESNRGVIVSSLVGQGVEYCFSNMSNLIFIKINIINSEFHSFLSIIYRRK